jgi:hypothetical protein
MPSFFDGFEECGVDLIDGFMRMILMVERVLWNEKSA